MTEGPSSDEHIAHNLWCIFDAISGRIGDRPAIRWRGNSWSFSQLRERSIRLANVLAGQGLGFNRPRATLNQWESGQDLIGTYLLNGPEYLEVTLAGLAARAAPFNVNYRYVSSELAYLLNDANAGCIVFHARFADRVAEVLPKLERVPLLLQVDDGSEADIVEGAIDYESALADVGTELSAQGHDPDDLHVVFTGGTTGMPKGTLWRQASIWEAALCSDRGHLSLNQLADHAERAEIHRFLPNAPLMHGAALWLALSALLAGDTVVINRIVDRLDPAEVWSTVAAEHVDSMLLVGEAFARPLFHELKRGNYDASSLRILFAGGARTSASTKRQILKVLPQITLLDTAGATETGGALRATSGSGDVGPDAVFVPKPGVSVLTDDLTAEVVPGHKDPGWFAKHGAIPLGYLGDEAKTRRTFPVVNGVRWVVPGDRARLRTDGLIQLLGRDAMTINTGGEKVFAEEVETALLGHPLVMDAVVVGRPSDRWGEEVVAVISVAGDAEVSDDELLAIAAERLARYKLPKVVVRVPKVRRSPVGKADYSWARDQAMNPESSG